MKLRERCGAESGRESNGEFMLPGSWMPGGAATEGLECDV